MTRHCAHCTLFLKVICLAHTKQVIPYWCCHKFSFSRSWTTQKQWKRSYFTILYLSCIFVKFSADLADHISPISNKCIFFGAFVYVDPLPFSALRRCVTSQESTIPNAHANAHAHGADAASLNASANASAATNTIDQCSPSLSWSAVQSSVLFALTAGGF